MIGGVELGGTKCILAVAKSPTDIIDREIISTDRPEVTLPKIFRFLNNFDNVFKKFIYIELGSDHYSYEEVIEKVNNFELLIQRSFSIEQAIKMIEGKSPSRVLVCGSIQLVGELIKDI